MFLHILKRDLKRKKTMNCIILLFVILSAMFFSSSVNNIISVMGGVDRFLDMAGMKDYVAVMTEPEGKETLGKLLDECSSVRGFTRETAIGCNADTVRLNGKRLETFGNVGLIVPADDMCITCFDEDNRPVSSVEKGKVCITGTMTRKAGIKEGDTVTFELCGKTLSLEAAGTCKDAVLGSDMIESPHFLISREDFDTLYADEKIRSSCRYAVYLIETDDPNTVGKLLSSAEGHLFSASKTLIRMTFLISISVAGIILAVSFFLILISFVVLRFAISFTVSEEFREIGVMKAIGLKDGSVRAIYLVKYISLSVIGAAVGFFAGIPFGRMLLDSVSRDMVLGNDHPVLIGVLCCAGVVVLIAGFCHGCTAKIRKLSPIDAVRSGQSGERFRRRSPLNLGKSRLGSSCFLALNDMISSPKQSVILTVVFTLCAVLVTVLSNTAQTLESDRLMYLISLTESDAYINLNSMNSDIQNGSKTFSDLYAEIEQKLAENGMPAKVHTERLYSVSGAYGDQTATGRFMMCSDTDTADYFYNEGTAPQYANEVALGMQFAETLGASVGDSVRLTVCGAEEEYIVTAVFDSFCNLGMCGRFHKSADLPDSGINGTMAYQIDFDDHPDQKTVTERIGKIKDIFDTENVFDGAGYVRDCTKAADAVAGAKNLTLIVALVIIVMMSVLLERSFISREKPEIALMKAVGFRNSSVILIHVLRFVMIAAVSLLIAIPISGPVTKLIMDPLFSIMGVLKGLQYAHNSFETFVLIPAVIFAAVTAGAFFTALYTGSVRASDTSDIE